MIEFFFFTAVKVTHYATIEIVELALVVHSPNTSRKAGSVRTVQQVEITRRYVRANLNHLIQLGKALC
jgi:hypothetical protein